MAQPPNEKKLEAVSFVTQVTRGLIRDQTTRRRAISLILITASVLLLLGLTVLRAALDPREQSGWFILYWLACGWFTVTALLLALFDLLAVRAQARREQRQLRQQHAAGATAKGREE